MKNLEPMGSKNLPERTVRPLAKLPVPEQKKAFKVATETAKAEGREVTGKDVEEAVKKSTPPPLVKIVDSVGRVIPKNLIELWNTREDPLEVCKLLSEARSLLKKAEETSNKAFSNIHLQTEIANVSGLYTRIKESVYYAVCGLCQGVGCKACKRGLMSRQQWEQLVPKETKDMILKGIKK